MVDGLGQSFGEDLGLQAALKKIFDAQSENIIQLHLLFWQDAHQDQAAQQNIAFEQALWILVLQHEQLTSNLSDLGQRQLNTPDLTFVSKTELSNQFDFL